MGLNLRNESGSVSHMSKEIRYRVWWSLCALDVSLSSMTGRPPKCNLDFCTTPLPVPFNEELFFDGGFAESITEHEVRNNFIAPLPLKRLGNPARESFPGSQTSELLRPNGSNECEQVVPGDVGSPTPNIPLYFVCFVELSLIMRESIDTLYSPREAQKSWREIEASIFRLNSKTDDWFARLPSAFRLTDPQETHDFERQRSSLAFRYYSAKIIITQPCLRRQTRPSLGTSPSSTGDFADTMAAQCVNTAIQTLNLLPEQPSLPWLYRISPWWCILHYVMQSITVLLTEFFIRAEPGTPHCGVVQEGIGKACRWLYEMSVVDLCSRRAWLICEGLPSRRVAEVGVQAGANCAKGSLG